MLDTSQSVLVCKGGETGVCRKNVPGQSLWFAWRKWRSCCICK